jgi:hypothetical protein
MPDDRDVKVKNVDQFFYSNKSYYSMICSAK